jgi:cytochrome c peroxidase
MARKQLGRTLSVSEIDLLVSFLGTLTGEYRGRPLDQPAEEPRP